MKQTVLQSLPKAISMFKKDSFPFIITEKVRVEYTANSKGYAPSETPCIGRNVTMDVPLDTFTAEPCEATPNIVRMSCKVN